MQKLEYFAERIEREVEARRQREKHQLANDLSRATAEAIAATQSKMASRVEAARREISRTANQRISAETRRARAAYADAMNAFVAEARANAAEDLQNFASSPEYEEWLTERVLAAKTKHDFADTVRLRPEDMELAEKLREATGLTPQPGESDYLGGFILQTADGKISADYTFATRLKEALQ